MKRIRLLLTFALVSICAAAQKPSRVADPNKHCQVIIHEGYTTGFYYQDGIPGWVSWTLCPARVEYNEKITRNGETFQPDPKAKGVRIYSSDYTRSGYDRGHMCPAADNRHNAVAMKESFYTSNICPQNHSLNEFTWCDLEKACRRWAKYGEVHIICGPILSENDKYIGKTGKVRVPAGFWKVVLKKDKRGKYTAAGWTFSNSNHAEPFNHHICSVDSIEELTGLDFFTELPDNIEAKIESQVQKENWHYNQK